jgi:SPP1 family predicted phage head-tail adaptor
MIGQLKHRAKIERIERVDNGRGGWTEKAVQVAEVWAAHYSITERQRVEFRKVDREAEDKMICRQADFIDQDCRVILNGRTYEIEDIERPIDTNDFMAVYLRGEKNGAQ